MSQQGIGLTEAIRGLRRELEEVIAEGEGQDLRFELEDIELELQVTVSREDATKDSVGGGINFSLIQVKGQSETSDKVADSQVQKVKLRLKPRRSDEPDTDDPRDGDTVLLSSGR